MHFRTALIWRDTVIHESSHWRTLRVGDRRGPPLEDPALIPGDALITVHGDQAVLHAPRDLTLTVNGEPRSGDVALSIGDTATLALRDTLLMIQPFVPEHRLLRGGVRMDSGLLTAVLLALTTHFVALIAAFLLFEDTPNLVQLTEVNRFAEIHSYIQPPEPPEPEMEAMAQEDPGKAAGEDEGTFGKEDERRRTKLARREGPPVERAREVGALKALGNPHLGGALKSVFGERDAFTQKINAGVAGPEGPLVIGRGRGMGIRRTGQGGGVQGFGWVGAQGLISDGPDKRARSRLRDKPKRPKKPRVTTQKGSFTSFCKPQDIQRVVTSRRRGVQHCYEKALLANPELSGKVTMVWRIGATGAASNVRADQNDLGSAKVAGCMRRVISRWKFPPPEGGVCQVRYPFVFSAGR